MLAAVALAASAYVCAAPGVGASSSRARAGPRLAQLPGVPELPQRASPVDMGESVEALKEEIATLREENDRLRGAPSDGKAPATLESLARTLEEFMTKTDHALHHAAADQIGDEVSALAAAEEKLSEQQIADAREAFDNYDADGSGAIDSAELSQLMKLLGEQPSPEELERVIQEVDDDKNGVIDFTEFLSLYALVRWHSLDSLPSRIH